MSAQTERITVLSTLEFKNWLIDEAKAAGVSLSELVRTRCQARPSEDEELLEALILEVRKSTKKADESLDQALKTAEAVFTEIRSRQA